jgi:heat shock protein HtpX
MEMCIDNPREGFADLFATHPSVDARIRALVKFAGGHDSGRIARADDMETEGLETDMSDQPSTRTHS